MNKPNIISIDIGNSRIKILDDFVYYAFDLSNDKWLETIEKIMNSELSENSRFVVSSVNSPALSKFSQLLQTKGLNQIFVDQLLQSSKIINFSRVKGMGNDRKLGLIGALSLATAPLVVIDVGTAVTVNFLNEQNCALGGAIFPGPGTQAKALNQFTDALPEVELYFTGKHCANSTETALQSGIFNSVVGGIKEIIAKGSKAEFKKVKPTILLTGGYCTKIAPLLDGMDFILESNLVLIGIRNLAVEYFSLIR